tara:strand:- start:4502 stop:6361 length:1860 start_codon:yes stop_codon:yes gene_type:complete
MINDNIENNDKINEVLEENLEPITQNNSEGSSEIEDISTETESLDINVESLDDDKSSNQEKKMINYLDKSIINIKQWDYSELDDSGSATTNTDNTELYNSGLDKKEKDVVKGTIVRVNERDVFVDIGFKSEGIISKSEFKASVPIVGDSVDVFIISFEDRRGNLILSREKAEFMLKWDELREKFENSEIISGKILRRIKGGMIVDLDPVQGFLPGSQIDIKPITNFDEYVGQESDFKIVKFNELRQNIVLSRKEILANDLDDKRKEVMEKLKVGDVLGGTVKNITDFGAFIDLGGIDGLLHITDITWGRINHPSEKISIGEELEVKIIDYDPETVRVSLGLKQLQSEPWNGIEDKYPINSVVKGKVVNMMKYGAFVELEEGVEGLVHVSEMSWTRHIKHPTDLFKIGDILEAKVLTVESNEKKISLGIKQLQDNPWDKIEEKYEVDSIHEGVVKNLTQYGAFVQLEEGVDGLVHISDMSWTEIVKHPKDVLNKGDKVKIKILDLSNKEHRLSLGIKQVTDNPWGNISKEYETGKKITTSIVKVGDKGATVNLDDNLEGIILFKSLSKDEKKRIKDIFVPDFELEVTVQEIDEELRKIILLADFSNYLTDLSESDSENLD